jgi:hypothetical protein
VESSTSRGQVLRAIKQETIAVKLVAVNIKGDRVLNHQVYRARMVGHPNLLTHLKAGAREPGSSQALGKRVT